MKKLMKHKKGQFVIIAMLMIAIMIISVGALMHRAVTYYKHEPWEEYLTLMGNIELNSQCLVELSLVNYTQTEESNIYILRDNLQKWQENLTRIYLGYGISLNYELASGTNYNYSFGLARHWNEAASFSAANVNFTLDIASIGLTGYEFMAIAFLNLTILNATDNEINLTVREEDGVPITSLEEDNFQVSDFTIAGVTSHYDRKEVLVYTIECDSAISTPVTVKVWDERGIQVTATGP
jgi:hypothetical protein